MIRRACRRRAWLAHGCGDVVGDGVNLGHGRSLLPAVSAVLRDLARTGFSYLSGLFPGSLVAVTDSDAVALRLASLILRDTRCFSAQFSQRVCPCMAGLEHDLHRPNALASSIPCVAPVVLHTLRAAISRPVVLSAFLLRGTGILGLEGERFLCGALGFGGTGFLPGAFGWL